MDDVRDIADRTEDDFSETLVSDLTLEEQLSAIERYWEGENFDLELESIRSSIETYSMKTVCQLGKERMNEVLSDLESFLSDEDLDFPNMIASNPHEWFRHYSESYPQSNVTVYHYRNLEDERIHVDVFEYTFGKDAVLYFKKLIDVV